MRRRRDTATVSGRARQYASTESPSISRGKPQIRSESLHTFHRIFPMIKPERIRNTRWGGRRCGVQLRGSTGDAARRRRDARVRGHSDGGSAGTGVPARVQVPGTGRVPVGVTPWRCARQQRGGRPAVSRREACGAFDGLIYAIVGLGAKSTWAGVPPATVPDSLGRKLAEGVPPRTTPARRQGCLRRQSIAAPRRAHRARGPAKRHRARHHPLARDGRTT